MALVGLGGMPLVMVGAAGRQGWPSLGSATGNPSLLDANAEAHISVGQIFTEDGGSHTINTTGSSSLGWLSGALTFANAATVVKVGLAAVDMATGPAPRAVNVANVITLGVSKSLTGGGGGITANAWQEHVPDAGSKTIANGDLVAFAVQMISVAGGDVVNVQGQPSIDVINVSMPSVTEYLAGVYTSTFRMPNVVITFSDGSLGWFFGGSSIYLTGSTTTTWNSGSATKEYGNFFLMPAPVSIYGVYWSAAISGNTDFILYTDPLGTPVAVKTHSVDLNTVGNASASRWGVSLFASPYSAAANQPLAAIAKPTSTTNVGLPYKTFNAAAHQKSETLGANGYAINRNTGAFAAQNSNKDRYAIGLLVGAWDNGAGAGGYPASRILSGM